MGLSLGLAGAIGLILTGNGYQLGTFNNYALFIVLATCFYAFSMNQIKSHLQHLTGVQVTSLSFLFIGPVAIVYLFTTSFTQVISNPEWPVHLMSLAILGIVGTALAMLLMNSLIRHSSAITGASVTYVIPIFAIMWGLLDNEKITALYMIFMILILAGVYLINRKSGKLSVNI